MIARLKAIGKLLAGKSLTPEEAFELAQQSHTRATALWEAGGIDRRNKMAAYEKIQRRIESWHPGEQYGALREFMINQILESTQYMQTPYTAPPDPPTEESAESWLTERRSEALADVLCAEARLAEAQASNEAKNKWLAGLRASVPQP